MPVANSRSSGSKGPGRVRLDRERVLTAAIRIADDEGLAALTMRSLASSLDSRPMSLYHYVSNKEEILDAIVDAVFAEIELPDPGGNWRDEMSLRAHSARTALVRHPWALALLETRTSPGPATLHHQDTVLGLLRAAGLSLPLTAHAFASMDAFIYGFALQEASLSFEDPQSAREITEPILDSLPAGEYPHMVEFATDHVLKPDYAFGDSFDFGLGLILSGPAAALEAEQTSPRVGASDPEDLQ